MDKIEIIGDQNLDLFTKIEEVQPITESSGERFLTRDMFEQYVEKPLLPACLDLYDKNIQTLDSSANHGDFYKYGYAFIILNWETLSDENKQVVSALLAQDRALKYFHETQKEFHVKLKIELSRDDTVDSISKKAMEMTNYFKKQKFLWGGLTNLQLQKMIGRGYSHRRLIEEYGFFYNPTLKLYYK